MKKLLVKIAIVIVIVVINILLILTFTAKEPERNESNIVDSLNNTIDSLEICIHNTKNKVDTVYKLKTTIKYIYEQKADTILDQSSDADWIYYTNFICTRFQDYTDSIKTN